MADLVCNIAKGHANEYQSRVNNNDPAAAVLTVVALVVTGDQDEVIRDGDTLAAILLDANIAEATNTNYARKQLSDTDLGDPTVDDTNNRKESDMPDQTWSAVAAGDNWTDLLVCYDPLGTDVDANLVPISLHDFSVTPDGSDIIAQINAAGWFRAA